MNASTYVIGDVHGQREKLVGLMRASGLTDETDAWTGGTSRLCFVGDYVDRGSDGIGVIETIMRLEDEAVQAGGAIHALLGNHDVMLLAAYHFGDARPPGVDLSLRDLWRRNGGRMSDMDRLGQQHIEWLRTRPAMALFGSNLLQHADSIFYAEYGGSLENANTAIGNVLQSEDFEAWATLVVKFVRRLEFDVTINPGAYSVADYLGVFGAQRLIHGHTPIPTLGRGGLRTVTQPWVYAEGRCVNVDGGMFLGQPGFVYQLDGT